MHSVLDPRTGGLAYLWKTCAVSVLWSLLVQSAGAAQSLKLNGPLARDSGGGVRDVRVSPDRAWVVYEAPQDSQEPGLFSTRIDGSRSSTRLLPAGTAYSQFEISSTKVVYPGLDNLYWVPIDGSRLPRAVLPPEPERQLGRMRLSPDGSRVVYVAVTPAGGGSRLYSATADGDKGPVQLTPIPPAGIIWNFAISSDGRRVVYVADQVQGVLEIFTVSIDGTSPAVKLNGPLVAGGDVLDYQEPQLWISPRGERVVYRADADTDEVVELYSAPIDGSASAVKLNGALVEGGDVRGYAISSDGRRVVYLADQASNDIEELYSVPIDAGAGPVRLNGEVTRAGDVDRFEISPDGRRVLYFASEDSNASRELQCAPIDGRAASLELSPRTYLADWPKFSPDGLRVVYPFYDRVNTDLYSVSLVDGHGIRLTQGPGPNGYPYPNFQFARDGSVVYVESFGSSSSSFELRRVALDGSGGPVVLAGPFTSGGLYSTNGSMTIGAGDQVLLHADLGTGVAELFSIPIEGKRELLRLNGPLVTDPIVADVTALRISPQGGRAVFTVRVGVDKYSHDELFSVRFDVRQRPILLFAQPSVHVHGREISADGRRVVFRAGNDDDERLDLYSVPADGGSEALQLNDPTTSRSGVGAFRLSPDGRVVAFVSYQGEGSELYAAPIEGGAEIELSGELVDGGYVSTFQVTSDGSRVVYLADQRAEGLAELFSVPIDGSSAPVVLSGPLVPGGDVHADFQLTPDGSTVVYAADQEADEVVALYRVPADGSALSRRLDRSPLPAGDVLSGFRIGADGRWVVYRADREVDEVFELHAVALDGSAGPVKLSGALVAGGDVQPDFELAPLGARVVYRADGELDERFELYGVALDGSAPPARLSGPLVAGGDVMGALSYGQQSMRISLDGARVLYRADAAANEKVELFSAPIDGSARPLSIAGPLPASADVLERFELTPDGKNAVYVADASANEVHELFAAPLEREKEARKLNGSLVPGGDAGVVRYWNSPEAFAITPDGGAVVYLADQDTDEVYELYLSFLGRPRRTPPSALR